MLSQKKTTMRGRVEFMRLDTPEIRAQLHQLSKLDNFQGFIRLGGDCAVWILAAIVAIRYPYLYPLSLIGIGSRMRAIENLMHETAHFTMFENRFLNDEIGTWLTAFPLHISLADYRKGHKIHHRYLGDEERDPDSNKYGDLPLPADRMVWRLLAIFTGVYALKENIAYFTSPYLKPSSQRELTMRLSFWAICFTLIGLTNSWWGFFWFYVIPYCTSFRTIRQLVDLSEHHLSSTIEHHTRNVLIHPILQFIIYPHADNIHLLHHICPSIPGNALPKAHELLLTSSLEYSKVPPFETYFVGEESLLGTAFKD
jgi:fatty acid desaturase